MIPMRIRVEGLLSYRDSAEVNFAEAPLWMLTGPNGAGKSTIFDAITLALFDSYRGDKQHHQELINQQCDSLKIEFEFQLGDDVYCARRTILRKGAATQHIAHVSGPTLIRSTRRGLAIVDNTGSEVGFKRWVEDHIGLDEAAFTASMLLQQGHADALIEMRPKDLHDTFAQLVNLDAYEQLHERIEARRKDNDDMLKSCQLSLQNIPAVADADVQVLAERVQTLQGQADDLQAQLNSLSDLKVKSTRWQLLSQRHGQLVDEQRRIDQLMRDADIVQQDAQRFDDLKAVLPRLEALHNDRTQMVTLEKDLRDRGDQCQTASASLDEARTEADSCAQAYEVLKAEHEAQREGLDAAKNRRRELDVDLRAIDELDKLRQKREETSRSLAKFSPNLDEQCTSVESEVQRLSVLKASLPWLTQFAQAKQAWKEAESRERSAEQRKMESQRQTAESEAREIELRSLHTQAVGQRDNCQSRVYQMQAHLEGLHKRLADFQTVEGKPNCPYCGLPLEPAHIEQEREAITQSLNQANQAVAAAERNLKTAQEKCNQLQQQLTALSDELQVAKSEVRDSDRDLEQARKDTANSSQTVELSFAHLSPELQTRIQPNGSTSAAALLASTFPTQQALRDLQAEAGTLDACASEHKALREQIRRRDDLRTQRNFLTNHLAEKEQPYPLTKVQQVRDEVAQLDQHIRQTSQKLTHLEKENKSAGAKAAQAREKVKIAEEQHQRLRDMESRLSAQRDTLETRTNQSLTELPVVWQAIAAGLTMQVLASYREEQERLCDAAARLYELRAGRQRIPDIQRRLMDAAAELSAIPAEAQVPAESLEQQERETQAHAKRLSQELSQVQASHHTSKDRRAQRQRLEQERKNFARQAYLCKELAQLLGREGLQRHLLEQTYEAIVNNANRILDRLSAGNLKIEFQADGSTDTGKTRHANLVAYHAPSGAKPIPLRCLSGGQRFRVAVSLALGIGQYATGAAQQIEAVIIDEGFGSLDETGRQEMIDAMHTLKSELKRIIIVSHQPEFAKAFPNRYEIEFVDGTSRVRLA